MKKIVFLRAYLCNNLGDDMFVQSVTHRYENVLFVIECQRSYRRAFKGLKGTVYIPTVFSLLDRCFEKLFHKRFFAMVIAKCANAFVHIGGSIFIEPEGFAKKVYMPPNQNSFTIGANFGPYESDDFFSYSRDRVLAMKDVCFRDTYSLSVFKEMDNVRYAPDVLFGYPHYPVVCVGNGLGISLISLEKRKNCGRAAEKYYSAIAQCIGNAQKKGMPVKLFAFCTHEGDDKAVENVVNRLSNRDVEIVIYDGDSKTFLYEFNSCEYIIATRFHALIIGWRLGKKVFPIIYSKKQTDVIDDIKFNGKKWDITEDFDYDVSRLFDDCLESSQLQNIDQYITDSQRQFSKLDEFLCEK